MMTTCSCSNSHQTMALNLIFVATIIILTSSNGYQVSAELPRFRHPTEGDQTLRFLVVGDWGRKGQYNQSKVALQMGRIGEELDIDFVVSTGDNFYSDGLTDEYDPSFLESYSNIYTERSLKTPWFVVLGNHDYRGDVLAQLSPVLNKMDDRWICLRSFIVSSGAAELFFVDTTPFVDEYFTDPKDHTYDWRGVVPVENYTSTLLTNLESALKKSVATWKIVVAHHTIRSVGHHGDTQELVERLLPILRAQDVDIYINGHDHNLQHISDQESEIQFFTSGGGSKAWRGDIKATNKEQEELKFFYDGQGFMSVEVTQMELVIVFYDVYGRVVHQWGKSKEPTLLGVQANI